MNCLIIQNVYDQGSHCICVPSKNAQYIEDSFYQIYASLLLPTIFATLLALFMIIE